MLLKNFWKQQKIGEELPSQIVPPECIKEIHSYCFVAISLLDPDPLANKIRQLCDDFHEQDKDYEFHLTDGKRTEITYYGHGDKRHVDFKSEIELRMANALTILNAAPNKSKIWSIRKPYDYAWIKKAIDCGLVPELEKLKFLTTKSYITYLQQDIGIDNIGNKSTYKPTFNKFLKEVANNTIPFIYKHHDNGKMIDKTETNRRNAIVQKFIELMSTA